MNAPTPIITADPREDAFTELERVLWSIQMHCEVGRNYAALGDLEGVEDAMRDARQCFGAALVVVREGLRDGR